MVNGRNHTKHDAGRPANARCPALDKRGALRTARWLGLAAAFLVLAGASGDRQAWGAGRWTLGQRAVVAAALKSTVPAELALAAAQVGREERLRGEGPREAVGVMHVLPSLAWEELGIRAYGLEDPRANAGVGVTLLERLNRRYEGRWDLTLSHYRRGPLLKCKEGPVMHDGTLEYAAAVMDWWVRYQKDTAVAALMDETRRGGFPEDLVRSRGDGDDASRRAGRRDPAPVRDREQWRSAREEGCNGAARARGQFRSDDGPRCDGARSPRFF